MNCINNEIYFFNLNFLTKRTFFIYSGEKMTAYSKLNFFETFYILNNLKI